MSESGNWIFFFFKEKITLKHSNAARSYEPRWVFHATQFQKLNKDPTKTMERKCKIYHGKLNPSLRLINTRSYIQLAYSQENFTTQPNFTNFLMMTISRNCQFDQQFLISVPVNIIYLNIYQSFYHH